MSSLIRSTMESGSAAGEGATATGSPTFPTSPVHSGGRSLGITSNNQALNYAISTVNGRTYFVRSYGRWSALPSTGYEEACSLLSGGTSGALVGVSSAGVVTLKNFSEVTIATGPTVSTGLWYLFEMAVNLGTGSVDTAAARVNGLSFANLTSQNLGDTALNTVGVGYQGSGTITSFFDDVGVNDDQGTSDNTWLGFSDLPDLAMGPLA